jgi:hypothetical protein
VHLSFAWACTLLCGEKAKITIAHQIQLLTSLFYRLSKLRVKIVLKVREQVRNGFENCIQLLLLLFIVIECQFLILIIMGHSSSSCTTATCLFRAKQVFAFGFYCFSLIFN